VGFVFVLLTAGLITYYDPDFSASSNSISSSQPIPNWVWLVCAVFHFTAHTLDGIDGKQARRTGTSGPLGELFDHGLDSWTSLFTPLCIYSIFGRADFSFPPIRVQFIFWSVFVTFYVSHWEKYVTGVLYLPWSYDMTQVTLLIMYLLSFSYGHYFWKFEYFGLSSGNIFELLTHVGSYAMSIPVTLYNVNLAIRSKTLKHKSWGERTRPLIPLFALFSITVGWSVYSPNDILDKHPRLFLFMTGTIFSNIAVSS
jgi:ethanolaminephosphotransferase